MLYPAAFMQRTRNCTVLVVGVFVVPGDDVKLTDAVNTPLAVPVRF
jgi:hypothetical protein